MMARWIAYMLRVARALGKAIRLWAWKRTLFTRAEWRDIEGHEVGVAYVSVSRSLLVGLKHDEAQGEAIAQAAAKAAHSSMLNLCRRRMEIGRYAPPE